MRTLHFVHAPVRVGYPEGQIHSLDLTVNQIMLPAAFGFAAAPPLLAQARHQPRRFADALQAGNGKGSAGFGLHDGACTARAVRAEDALHGADGIERRCTPDSDQTDLLANTCGCLGGDVG